MGGSWRDEFLGSLCFFTFWNSRERWLKRITGGLLGIWWVQYDRCKRQLLVASFCSCTLCTTCRTEPTISCYSFQSPILAFRSMGSFLFLQIAARDRGDPAAFLFPLHCLTPSRRRPALLLSLLHSLSTIILLHWARTPEISSRRWISFFAHIFEMR